MAIATPWASRRFTTPLPRIFSFSPFALTLEAEAFGSELVFLPDYAPNIRKPAVRSADAFLDLQLPDVDTHPSLLYLRQAVRAMQHNHGGEVPICGMLTASVDLPAIVMGIDSGWKPCSLRKKRRSHPCQMRHPFQRHGQRLAFRRCHLHRYPAMFTNPRLLYRRTIDKTSCPP
jgi:uroporphyrinogen decarboxylase